MDSLATLFAPGRPCASHPLRGLTILSVENGRETCETLRLMCQHSGARLRRADDPFAARRHLRVYRPAAVIVDIGLPDGVGMHLLAGLSRIRPRPALLATSADPCDTLPAEACGADGFLDRPPESLAAFQRTVLGALSTSAAQERLPVPGTAMPAKGGTRDVVRAAPVSCGPPLCAAIPGLTRAGFPPSGAH